MMPFPATDYLAGLWRGALRDGLLWVNPLGRDSSRIQHARGGFPKLAGAGSNWRISGQYAPSWSWASISGPVAFGFVIEGNSVDQVWRIVDAQCTPKTSNPYGPVSGGFVVVDGYLLPITIQESLRDEEQTPNGNMMASRELCVLLSDRENVTGLNKTWMDAGLGAREWEDEDYDYFLLSLGKTCASRGIPVGMILRRLKMERTHCYARVGMARLDNWHQEHLNAGAKRQQFRIV